MRFVYKGKYSGDESTLPQREHPEGYVPYKEPNSMKKLALLLNGISIIVLIFMFWVTYMILSKNGIEINKIDFSYCMWVYAGGVASLIALIPHELLHAICFKEEVLMFQNLKQAMLFVVGTEDMSKLRFIFMSMLPNIVFGFIPYLIFIINPNLIFFGIFGLASICGGVGDYMNVFNTIFQVPKGGIVYMSGMHSYWYIPKT